MELPRGTFTIDIRRLRVLREVHSRGTLFAAAQALNLTPSAISQQIAGLARDLGAPLLERQGRRVRLSPQARLLLDHAVRIDAELERTRADLARLEEGTVGRVAIGAFATAISGLVASAVALVRRERPRLEVAIEEVEAPACFTRLDRGDLDLVITVDYRGGPPRGDPRYARLELLDDPLLVALKEGHPLAEDRAVDLLALSNEPFIVGASRGPCEEAVLATCSAAGFSPRIAHEVNDWGALLHLVAQGYGVGLVPRLAVALARPPGVALRLPRGRARPCRHLYAAVRAGAEGSPSLTPILEALAMTARRFAASPLEEARQRRATARREGRSSGQGAPAPRRSAEPTRHPRIGR
jgi:DNA-binding transcriptional LysR family regulator